MNWAWRESDTDGVAHKTGVKGRVFFLAEIWTRNATSAEEVLAI